MELTFVGTRANIPLRNRRHRRHSVLKISMTGASVLIDCGSDWLSRLARLSPTAIVLTHAHPDHIGGLIHGAPCPVYAPADVWATMPRLDLMRKVMIPREPTLIDDLVFEAFPVTHSLLAPAVGYRVATDQGSFFYVPDVVRINDEHEALAGAVL